jgi:hypothetical protein
VSALRGTTALLLFRAPRLRKLAIWAGLFPGLLVGANAQLQRAPGEAPRIVDVVSLALGLGSLLWPVFASYVEPVLAPAGARSRREELLALPTGRLAIPAAGLIAAVVATAATVALFLGGIAAGVGLEPVRQALLDPSGFSPLAQPRAALLEATAFALATAVGAIGQNPAAICILWPALPLLIYSSAERMGYSPPERDAYTALWQLSLLAYYLVLPFVLYAGPPHRWASARGERSIAAESTVFVIAALVVLALAGCGWLLGAFVALGAACIAPAAWRAPRIERPRWTAAGVSLAAALAVVAPAAVVGVVADAARMADSERIAGKDVPWYVVAPGGRFAALSVPCGPETFTADGVTRSCLRITRVALVDLDRGGPPRVLSPRFAELEAASWSADGRYLAIQDCAIGRLQTDSTRARVASRAGDLLVSMLPWRSTLVLDTQTGKLLSLQHRELAPGWTSWRELVDVSLGLDGLFRLSDGRGGSAILKSEAGAPAVLGYDHGAAIVKLADGPYRFDERGLAPLGDEPLGPWRLDWRMRPVDRANPDAPRLEVTAERGAERVRIEGLHFVFRSCSEFLLAKDPSGFVRIDLPSGARTTLVPASMFAGPAGPTAISWLAVGEGPMVVALKGGARALVDPRAATATPLASTPGFKAECVIGDRWLGRGRDDEVLVRDGLEGPIRPLVPPSGE